MAGSEASDYGGSWYASRMVETPPRGRLSLELDVDVCVIGGGLAGLTIALEVAKRGWSVAVLEARRVAWNASGRNAGFVRPGFPADPLDLIDKVGPAQARTLWAMSEAGADYVRRTIRETQMAGAELDESGWLHVSRTAADAKLAASADFLGREFGTAAEFWPAERVRTHLRSTRYFGGLYLPGAFSINPLNYALGLAAAAEAVGARIFEETRALEIDPTGVRKRITTPSARVRAAHVVLAGNVHIGNLMTDLAGALVPISAYSIVTEPLGDRLRDAIRFRGAVTDNDRGDSAHRVVDGDRLLWADRCTVWERDPRRYKRALLAEIRRIYPQLGAVNAEYAWTGTLGATVHRMPQLGELSPGVWVLSGFGGQGINTTAMGGETIARAILDGGQAWRLFQPFDLVWAGGRLGRAAVQVAYWCARTREQVQGFLARRAHPAQLPEVEPMPTLPPEEPVEASAKPKRRQRKSKTPQASDPAPAN
ncbi:MAG: FAD-binding oxidoreductase [Xanthobacteraceae bacterium]